MIEQFQIGSLRNFVYLISDSGESVVVDPQKDLTPWERRLEEKKSKLVGVLLTHTHHDHVAGVPAVCEKYGVPVYLHSGDAFRAKKEWPLHVLNDHAKIKVGNIEVELIHSPGHSAGEVSYLIRQTRPWSLLTGDTVFVGMVGRTDFETGDDVAMFETIEKIKKLPGETIIYPGHDYGKTPTSTIAREMAENEAFRCKTVEELKAVP